MADIVEDEATYNELGSGDEDLQPHITSGNSPNSYAEPANTSFPSTSSTLSPHQQSPIPATNEPGSSNIDLQLLTSDISPNQLRDHEHEPPNRTSLLSRHQSSPTLQLDTTSPSPCSQQFVTSPTPTRSPTHPPSPMHHAPELLSPHQHSPNLYSPSPQHSIQSPTVLTSPQSISLENNPALQQNSSPQHSPLHQTPSQQSSANLSPADRSPTQLSPQQSLQQPPQQAPQQPSQQTPEQRPQHSPQRFPQHSLQYSPQQSPHYLAHPPQLGPQQYRSHPHPSTISPLSLSPQAPTAVPLPPSTLPLPSNIQQSLLRQSQNSYTPPHRQDDPNLQALNLQQHQTEKSIGQIQNTQILQKDYHPQPRSLQDEERAASKLLFSLAVRQGFRPFKSEAHALKYLRNLMIEPGDLVDRLFKNPEAIWNICKRAPHSIVVMDALLVVLANKKLYETVKLSKLNQLIHGVLKGTNIMHKGISSYMMLHKLEPSMVATVVNFYFAILPYLTNDECKGIPFEQLRTYQYARKDVVELSNLAHRQVSKMSIKYADVLPTNGDINIGPAYQIRKNVVDEAWPDFETYIRTQFTLLREDFTNPLREVLRAVGANMPSKSHPWLMRDVKAESLVVLPSHTSEVGMQVSFKLQRRVVNWDSFDHFKMGELVCLNDEKSDKWIFAVVMFTDLSVIRRGSLIIKFIREADLVEFDWEQEYTMVESTNFFGAVHPVLERLQVLRSDRGFSVGAPPYLEMEPMLYENLKEVTGRTEFNVLDRWPDSTLFPALRVILDPSQSLAMKHMMLNRLAIIQGPPGTGKSFVGVKAVQLIASSLQKHREAFVQFQQHISADSLSNLNIKQIAEQQQKHLRLGPILVICYTNHALDQFLADLLPHLPNLIRVGGRSRSTDEKLARRNLANLLLQPVSIPFTRSHLRRLIKIRKIQGKLLSLMWECYKYPNNCLPNVLPENLRQQFMTSDSGFTFEDINAGFQMWESGGIVPPPEKLQEESIYSSSGSSTEADEVIDIVETQEDIELEKQRDMRVKMLFEQYQQNTVEGNWEIFEKSKKHWEQQSMHGILPVKPMPGFTPDSLLDKRRRNDEMTINDEDNDMDIVDPNEKEEDEGDEEDQNKDVELDIVDEVRKAIEEALEGWSGGMGEGVSSVWQMEVAKRKGFWNTVVEKSKKKLRQQIDSVSADFNRISQEFQELRDQKRLAVLREAPLVGMTSTQAATLSNLLHVLAPSVLVVEEAAELLESQLLSCFMPSIQHLILIGDHQQLRPKVSDYESELKYDLHISMYERLLRLGVPKSTLNRQVRMRPEIADLMRLPDFYPDLQDHSLVTKYPRVKGMSHNLFFVTHQFLEDGDEDNTVKRNMFEATYAYRLACYLMLQGYLPNEITILTPYAGQFREINNQFSANKAVPTPKIITIDDYQGEENKIVILSLVRSNSGGVLGFTKVTNRIVVALSRAKHGMYIIGNGEMLSYHNKHWRQVVNLMKNKRIYGCSLAVTCQKHFDMTLNIVRVEDFNGVNSFGGCLHACKELLPCGHRCPLPCHPSDHSGIACTQPCARRHQCGHPCAGHACCDECPSCREKEIKLLPCGHRQEGECGLNVYNTQCKAPCRATLPCGHPCLSECGMQCPPCKQQLKTIKDCGHTVEYTCGSIARCRKFCEFIHPCGHPCIGNCSACHFHHIPCTEPCGRTLVCGHRCTSRCGRPCVCTQVCESFCAHYKCTHKCDEMCAPCLDPCAWVCAHFTCTRPCYQMCNRPLCNKRCRKQLPCKHQCRGLCGELCPPCATCEPNHLDSITNCLIGNLPKSELLFKLHGCGHVFSLDSIDDRMLSLKKTERISFDQKLCPTCDEPIRYSLRYGNILKGQKVHIENMKYQWKQVSSTFNPAFAMPVLHGYSEGSCFICPNGHPYFLGDSKDINKTANCPDCGVILEVNEELS